MALTLAEQETHLNLTADDRQTWHVYSDDPVMMRRLERIGATVTKEEYGGGKHYTLPDSQITFRKPRKPMSEAQRVAQAERLRQARKLTAKHDAENLTGQRGSEAAE